MSVSKGKSSRTRTKQRRSHDALKKKNLAKCGKCGKPTQPHRACSNCGFYRGREVKPLKVKKVKK